MVKNGIVFLFIILFISPYLILFKDLNFVSLDTQELGRAFLNTTLQALLSTLGTLIFGMVGALGLCAYQGSRKLKYFEFLCLMPSFLPALFFVTAILQIIKPFPFGLAGIVFIHVLTYVGLAALFYQSVLQNKFQKLSELALIEGATKRQFFFAVLKNIPYETLMIFLFLFVQFFTSFSVPLLVGHQSLTIETLIYEKIRSEGSLSHAAMISFFESLFIMILLLFYRAQRGLSTLQSYEKIRLLNYRPALVIVTIPVVIYVLGSLIGSSIGIQQLLKNRDLFDQTFPLILKSVILSLLTGITLVIALSAITYTYKNRFLDKFLLSFIPLSTVLIGLSFLLVNVQLGYFEKDVKFLLAMLIIFLPVLYRYQLKARLYELESQIEVASLMGSTRFLTFKKIVFPQVFPTILFLAGLGAFWSIGDFAISQIIYGKDVTLALFIQNLVGSYRLELANILIFVLLILGLLIFMMFNVPKNSARE